MTLPPERIGDKGQRFEIRGRRRGFDADMTVGWCEDRASADALAKSMRHWPYLDGKLLTVVDRQIAAST